MRRELAGEVADTEQGPVLLRGKRYPPSYRHGRFPAADFQKAGAGLAALAEDQRFAELDPCGALFLDTETTGLAGGTGTLPFLVGVGRLNRNGGFEVEQYFCREPAEERAQIGLLAARLARAEYLVTFNGKAFDVPLLNTRFVLQRMKNPGYDLPHLDLLFVARRVFKRRLESCSLGSLESAVLGFEREGDIPGHAIPAAYTAYLRGGPTEPMEAVLEHNALDLVGLAALGGALEEMYRDPSAVEHAADHLGLARAALAAGERAAADDHLHRAGASASDEHSRDAFALAARTAARRGELERSKALWYKALERTPDEPAVHLALAKHLEHRDKDFAAAIEHARRTVEIEGEDGSAHRVARLERRLAKQRQKGQK